MKIFIINMFEELHRIASFDIGKKNFAQYVEGFNLDKLKDISLKYKNLPTNLKRRVKGDMNDDIQFLLDETCKTGSMVQMGVYDLRSEECAENKSKGVDMQTRINIINHLESHMELWKTCDIFLVEQQFVCSFTPKGRKGPKLEANIDAIKIGELVMTFFLIHFPFAEIIHYGSQFKTQILGAPNGLTKPQRKKWSVEKAMEIFRSRDDEKAIEQIERGKKEKQKQDDVADSCVQCQAFKYRNLVGEF